MDVITYCSNTSLLIAELQEIMPSLIHVDESGHVFFLVSKTPTVRNGNETMALVRDLDGSLVEMAEGLTHLTVLGTYEEVFADPAKCVTYDRVYDQTPVIYIDEEGIERTHTPPRMFGVFPE